MKKVIVIASCCIALLFVSCNKEKDNERFVGNYEGPITTTATLSKLIATQFQLPEGPINIEMDGRVNLSPGTNDNEVIAIISLKVKENQGLDTIAAEGIKVNGVCNGDKITFETITDTLTFNRGISDEKANIPMTITINSQGLLNGKALKMTGDGSISIETLGSSIPAAQMAFEGTLNKK